MRPKSQQIVSKYWDDEDEMPKIANLSSKNKQAKKARIHKKQKKLKKRNYKVASYEKEHTWWTEEEYVRILTNGTGFVVDQTNLRVDHG